MRMATQNAKARTFRVRSITFAGFGAASLMERVVAISTPAKQARGPDEQNDDRYGVDDERRCFRHILLADDLADSQHQCGDECSLDGSETPDHDYKQHQNEITQRKLRVQAYELDA